MTDPSVVSVPPLWSLRFSPNALQMKKIVIASNNTGKLRELSALLKPLGIETVS